MWAADRSAPLKRESASGIPSTWANWRRDGILQKRFTDKAKSELIAAERNVDKMIKEFKEEREVKVGTQNELFG